MSDIAIRVENLSKMYRIGTRDEQPRGLVQAARSLIVSPFAYLRRMRRPPTAEETLWALKDVSFEVKHGEVLGIIGRNGAGKSTLLKILSRITEPSSGQAQVFGRVGSLLEVGTGFHPELTGRENIYLNGAILGMKRAEIDRKFDEIVVFSGVEKFLDTPVKRYSSGMYVRLAFAVAAHLEPEILVVDEVLAVGDAEFQKKCLSKMGDIANNGKTVLFVSHNMVAVQSLCKRGLWVNAGTIYMDSSSRTVVSGYLSNATKGESATVDLRQHPGRSRSREAALTKLWITDKRNNPTNSILMGESLNIIFKFRCTRNILNPGFGYGVEDEFGRRIFSMNNYLTPHSSIPAKSVSSGVASLHIPQLILLPGTYFVSISLVENEREWVDFVERAITFQVQPSNVFGSTRMLDRSQGIVYVPGEVSLLEYGQESHSE